MSSPVAQVPSMEYVPGIRYVPGIEYVTGIDYVRGIAYLPGRACDPRAVPVAPRRPVGSVPAVPKSEVRS